MAQTILTALENTQEKLEKLSEDIAAARVLFYNALVAVGVTNCTDSDTFETYAKLIKNNLSTSTGSPFIMEVTIPDTTSLTAYKRTVVLPMYFGVDGNNGYSLNTIADEIIAANAEDDAERLSSASSASVASDDGGVATASLDDVSTTTTVTEEEEDPFAEYKIVDPYGNEIIDGNAVIETENPGEGDYASDEENDESNDVIVGTAAASENLIGSATTADEWEQNGDTTYSYYVDWGDGTDYCYYDDSKTYSDNKAAIWHTYENDGASATYDIRIYGTYKRVYCGASYSTTNSGYGSLRTSGGSYVYDNDGVALYSSDNYGYRRYLVEVISWGVTGFTNLSYAFGACKSLTSVPMYDTTSAFTDVTTCQGAFNYCTALTSLPFNSNTNKGLFSDCENITTFANCFSYCTGYTDEIPVKLCDGCSAVTSVAGMFAYSTKISGSIPTGLFSGMTALTTASEVFASCSGMDGELSTDLFADSPKITSIYRLFYGCTSITGTFYYDTIGKLSALTDMRQAFYNCTGLTGFALGADDDTFTEDLLHDGDTYDSSKSYAFYDLTSSGINCRQAFYGCTGITSIPDGLIESLTGTNHYLEKMFEGCTKITSLSLTSVENLHVSNARGMFGGCTAIATALPNANDDWSTYEGMKRWFGAFANTALSDIDEVCLELGGDGDRLFTDRHVGAIVLADETLVDPKDYSYDSSNVPMGIVYADVYLDDSKSIATLASGSGNVVDDETDGSTHKLFCTVLNDTSTYWTYLQTNAENVTTITNTTDVNVGYNRYTWSTDSDGNYTATRAATRYNGEAYTEALLNWQVSQGYVDDITDITSTSSTIYRAVNYCYIYSSNGTSKGQCFLPDGADLWDQFTMRNLINKACTAIISGGSHTSSTCYPMRNGTGYWASAEYSSTNAWNCYTYYAYLNVSIKWGSGCVRPSFAIDA